MVAFGFSISAHKINTSDVDNVTITYGHNLAPLDPYANPYFFNNDYTRRRELLPPEPNVFPRRQKRAPFVGYIPVFPQVCPKVMTRKKIVFDFRKLRSQARILKKFRQRISKVTNRCKNYGSLWLIRKLASETIQLITNWKILLKHPSNCSIRVRKSLRKW